MAGRDAYDVRGRVAHESVFNINDGNYRCPRTQQGYSPFTTWTRGLAWAICGFAEQLEFFAALTEQRFSPVRRNAAVTPPCARPPKLPAIFTLKTLRPMAFLIGIQALPV